MYENLREELMELDGAFRAIMATRAMSEENYTVFQYALDSIDYIIKSQNWLDDKWVYVGFQNIEKAKVLLKMMLSDDDPSNERQLGHAREVMSRIEGICYTPKSFLSKEERERLERMKRITRQAIQEHNQRAEREHFAKRPSSTIGRGSLRGQKTDVNSKKTSIGTHGSIRTPQQMQEDARRREEDTKRTGYIHSHSDGHGHGRR